jgi:hypothetical protein
MESQTALEASKKMQLRWFGFFCPFPDLINSLTGDSDEQKFLYSISL